MDTTERYVIRLVRLTPYLGSAPSFSLRVWDTHRTWDGKTTHRTWDGKTTLGYELRQHEAGRPSILLFQGEDFHASPLHTIDSNATMAAILGFLTLRPGDTDPDYFANYTDVQRTFCEQHAEALAVEVYNRFGEV